jgi:hypothetical protein
MVTTVVPAAAAPPGRASAPGGVHDAFISYSRRDRLFAAKLEAALERYLPPRDLGVARRRLDIFRDEEDFTGAEYHASLEQHLRNSATLIVICSPHARASKYVNDEIRRFVLLKGAENPHSAVGRPQQRGRGRFQRSGLPGRLVRGARDAARREFRRHRSCAAAHRQGTVPGLVAHVLAKLYGTPRSVLEQRERKRRARTLRAWAAFAAVVMAALTTGLIVTLISRQDAVEQRGIADVRRREAEAERDRAERAAQAERAARAEEKRQRQIAEEQRQEAEQQRQQGTSGNHRAIA